jgi:hypothetical protein
LKVFVKKPTVVQLSLLQLSHGAAGCQQDKNLTFCTCIQEVASLNLDRDSGRSGQGFLRPLIKEKVVQHMYKVRNAYRFLVQNVMKREHFRDLDIDKIILQEVTGRTDSLLSFDSKSPTVFFCRGNVFAEQPSR